MADESTRAQLEIDPAVGTVEMKITARARDEDEVLEALEQAHIEPEARDVYFFDTTDLTLFEAGNRTPRPSGPRRSGRLDGEALSRKPAESGGT